MSEQKYQKKILPLLPSIISRTFLFQLIWTRVSRQEVRRRRRRPLLRLTLYTGCCPFPIKRGRRRRRRRRRRCPSLSLSLPRGQVAEMTRWSPEACDYPHSSSLQPFRGIIACVTARPDTTKFQRDQTLGKKISQFTTHR